MVCQAFGTGPYRSHSEHTMLNTPTGMLRNTLRH